MPRKPRPWYRVARRQWYSTVNGRPTPLGVSDPGAESAAWAALQALLARAAGDAPVSRYPTLQSLCEAWYADLATRAAPVKPQTITGYRETLRPILARYGTVHPAQLDPAAVERFVGAQPWRPTTKAGRLCALETALRWGGHPTRFQKPAKESAGADSVIPEEVMRAVLLVCVGDWRAVIHFLWLTGARPQEAARLTAEQVDWTNGVARIREHKTARKGKSRTLYLCPQALALLRAQRDRHGTGHLFRGKGGRPFSVQAFVAKFIRLSERVGSRVTAYGLRHTFATRALERGVPDAQVAAMLGHTGTQMLHRHYAHLGANARLLRGQAAHVNAPLLPHKDSPDSALPA